MTRQTVRAALVALAASLLLAGCAPAGRPLARVGARTITSADLLEAGRGNEAQYPPAPEEAKLALLNDLVRRELLLEAARNRGMDTTRYARQFLENTRDKLALDALYKSISPPNPGVSEAETQRFYEWRATQAAVRVIYSPARHIIEAAMADLARGQSFAAVADRYNMPGTVPPGGAVGMVSPGMLVPPLDLELLTLPAGHVGGPYDTPQGLFLMIVERREPAERPSYELAQTQLAEQLRQRKMRQTMSKAFVTLRDEYGAKVEEGAAARMFQLMTPTRVGEGDMPEVTPEERAEVLARWRGGQFTVGDAFDDLQRPDVGKPPASMTPAIEQWIEGRVITRIARAEVKRRHIAEDPDVARRIRGEYERYLLDAEFNSSIADVPPPDEAMKRETWEMLKHQYQQMSRANVQWVIIPDSATARRVASFHGQVGVTLEDAVRMAGSTAAVQHESVSFPTSDPNWIPMRETLASTPPGEWVQPSRAPGGFKFIQVIDKVQEAVTYENMTPDMRQSVENNAWQLARERRLNAYTDSLRTALQPNVYAENLRFVPWPPPATIDVGK